MNNKRPIDGRLVSVSMYCVYLGLKVRGLVGAPALSSALQLGESGVVD